mmetsp:Transcript_2408/g.6727  ORF Transcript_2408/g.6727 Transcript_2408/m.6727 type:complete len:98 (-) Transcript_2408:622-915(-)
MPCIERCERKENKLGPMHTTLALRSEVTGDGSLVLIQTHSIIINFGDTVSLPTVRIFEIQFTAQDEELQLCHNDLDVVFKWALDCWNEEDPLYSTCR